MKKLTAITFLFLGLASAEADLIAIDCDPSLKSYDDAQNVEFIENPKYSLTGEASKYRFLLNGKNATKLVKIKRDSKKREFVISEKIIENEPFKPISNLVIDYSHCDDEASAKLTRIDIGGFAGEVKYKPIYCTCAVD